MSVADYMGECLLHPAFGYYATRDPLGAAGDFTTAPEISQVFGEILGLALAQAWLDQGRPSRARLIELGPGRGTLMADMLRAMRAVPGLREALRVDLVEASPALRALQRERLAEHRPDWAERLEDVPEGFALLVANEFVDALPVRQFVRQGAAWRERMVGLEGNVLGFGLSPPTAPAFLAHRLSDTPEGGMVEWRPAAAALMGEIERRLSRHGGAALVIDYGGWRSRGDTLQAVRAHAYADPLAAPGEADLTAHVDFEALALAAPGLDAWGPTPQGVFLERLGAAARAQALAQGLAGAALAQAAAAHRRLTHPEAMGTLFKTAGFTPRGAPAPAGLDPAPGGAGR